MKRNSKRIVVTGLGPLASVGIGKDNFWQGILNKRINIKKESCCIDGKIWDEFFVHKIADFDIADFGIDKDKLGAIKDWKEGEEITDLNYILAAVKLALDDSGLDYNSEENNLGIVLAHENLGLMPFASKISDIAYEMLINKKKDEITKISFFNKFYRSFLKSGYDLQTFADLFHVAKVFNIHNYSLFINNACASGLYALEAASQIIKSNQAKAVVIASSDQPEIYKYLWFKELGIYAEDGIIRPFGKDSKGLVFGEGGAGIVLEDYDYAINRKAFIYAEYLGGGFDLEGWKITAPQIGSDSYLKAILKALRNSDVEKNEIDLLCLHGVASQPIDYYEAKAVTDVFGTYPQKPVITAFKPYVGHNLGSSALLEAVILLLSLKNGIVPPTLNCSNIDPKFNISLENKMTNHNFNIAMKCCCAFAGFNSAAIFKRIN